MSSFPPPPGSQTSTCRFLRSICYLHSWWTERLYKRLADWYRRRSVLRGLIDDAERSDDEEEKESALVWEEEKSAKQLLQQQQGGECGIKGKGVVSTAGTAETMTFTNGPSQETPPPLSGGEVTQQLGAPLLIAVGDSGQSELSEVGEAEGAAAMDGVEQRSVVQGSCAMMDDASATEKGLEAANKVKTAKGTRKSKKARAEERRARQVKDGEGVTVAAAASRDLPLAPQAMMEDAAEECEKSKVRRVCRGEKERG